MNLLRKLNFSTKQPSEASTTLSTSNRAEHIDAPINSVQLPVRSPLDNPVGLLNQPVANTPIPQGLMDAPELKDFFADNYFGLGQHNGARYQTQEAFELGKGKLVAKFQNIIEVMVEQKLNKVDRIHNMTLQTAGVSPKVTAGLNLACQKLERDITTLQAQSERAAEQKGWALSALNDYQIGFNKGLQEAVDGELLLGQ